jgi:hypothetical protein
MITSELLIHKEAKDAESVPSHDPLSHPVAKTLDFLT